MKGLDLRRFKKVGCDEHMTTFKDKAGHELRVAHKALSEGRRKQLEAIPSYADGGEVEPLSKRTIASGKKFGTDEEKLNDIRQFDAPKEQETLDAAPKAKYSEWDNIRDQFGALNDKLTTESQRGTNYGGGSDFNERYSAIPANPIAAIKGPAPASLAPPEIIPQATPAVPPQPIAGGGSGLMGTANQFTQGVNQEAQAIGQQGKQQAAILNEQAQTQQALMQSFNDKSTAAMNEVNAVMQDYQKQYINPNHYMENMSSGQKVSTAIGLMLSGMGSGLTGQENLAAKFLNQQIDRDIEAQKANLGKKENLLNFNLKQYGNMKDALTMTNAMQMGIYASKIEQAAALSKDPIAKARGLQLAAEFKAKIIPQVNKLAQSQALQGLMQSGGNTENDFKKKLNALSAVSPEHYKDVAERYIPGVGIAAMKPTDKDRESLTAAKQMKSALTELQARAATFGTTIPGTEADKVNKTKVAAIQLQMKNAYQLGVLSQSDLDMLDKLVANPGSIFTNRSISQLEATKKSMDSIEKGVIGKLGVTPFQGGSAMEGRTATDPRGNKIIMQNGKWVPYGR